MSVRPVTALCMDGIVPAAPPTPAPTLEWMAPADLSIDQEYQRDLSPASVALIRRIVAEWDWRKFKPPIVAWTEEAFEVIDGQHTAIAAASHPLIDKIPVVLVEAPDQADRARAFIGQNTGHLTVTAMQKYFARVTAGDEDALTVKQVCERAGINLLANQYGGQPVGAGDSHAIGAIEGLIARRYAAGARPVLEALVKARCAPITAHEIKAAEHLLTNAEFTDQMDPEDLPAAIITSRQTATAEATVFAKTHCVPHWRGLVAVWFKKARKRRKAA